ncbi:MAG: sigma-54-dependent Fis family transcriptional regulator [Polyangiaceae bacterium]|nr:sigma-54-dependent Fis family transcriptional regulator [Polyangiaceae bacterium]
MSAAEVLVPAGEALVPAGGTLAVAMRDDRLSLLLELGAIIHREVGLDALLDALADRVARALGAERATIFLVDAATGELRSRVAVPRELPEIRLLPGQGLAGAVAEGGRPLRVVDPASDPRWCADVDRRTGYTTRSMLAVPVLDARKATRGVVQVINKLEGAFSEQDEIFLATLANQIALAFEWTTLRPDGAPRGVWLRGPYNHIVGDSEAMQAVYRRLERAAATDATVLLTGETGTGKGLVARAIHANSRRSGGPFAVVDCTTLPSGLVESELFGYERGAFTGAERRTPGRVEAAQRGTLFLDEIGELPPPAQAKLLRLLQERRFERVGGRETIEVDVRIVAATHRDLSAEVARDRFRSDLFYRLRVVEIALPPLRERGPAEVVALARHFLSLYVRRHDREGVALGPAALAALAAHRWPGNVRELEFAIERAVVLVEGSTILPEHLGLSAVALPGAAPADGIVLPPGLTLDEAARRYAEATLEACGGNRTEAARRLGVGRNTLARKTPKR